MTNFPAADAGVDRDQFSLLYIKLSAISGFPLVMVVLA